MGHSVAPGLGSGILLPDAGARRGRPVPPDPVQPPRLADDPYGNLGPLLTQIAEGQVPAGEAAALAGEPGSQNLIYYNTLRPHQALDRKTPLETLKAL